MPIDFKKESETLKKTLESFAGDGVGTAIPGLMARIKDFVANPDSVSVYTYQRMVETDETVGAGVDLLTRSVVGRLGDYSHADPEITDFIHAVFDAMEGTLQSLAREILTAKWAGFSVTEKVMSIGVYQGRPVVSVEKLQTLPPSSIAFEVDKLGNVTPDGVIQFDRSISASPHAMLNAFIANDSLAGAGNRAWPERLGFTQGRFVRIPKENIIHFITGMPRFKNPYGRSPLRRA